MIHKIFLTTLCLYILAPSSTTAATATFQRLGDFTGGSFSSSAMGVSADGSIVVGSGTTASGSQTFRWTQSTGMVSLGNLSNNSFKQSGANSISEDGSTIVGWGNKSGAWSYNTNNAFRWTLAEGMVTIPSLNGASYSEAGSVSADGSVVVGNSGLQAFRWTQNGGTVGLGNLSGKTMSRALSVSDDGSVVVGGSSLANFASEQAFRWTQSGGMQGLGFLPGDSNNSWADDISPDGSVIIGTSAAVHAFRWTQSTGMVNLGYLPGMNTTHALDVSNYGSTIVGVSYSDVTYQFDAFIWDAAHGMRNLQSVLQTEYGLNLTGWDLQIAYGISADGNVIVGEATNPSGQTEAFRVILVPEPATFLQLCLVAILLGLAGIRRLSRCV